MKRLLIAVVAGSLAGCSLFRTLEGDFSDANKLVQSGQYAEAAKQYDQIRQNGDKRHKRETAAYRESLSLIAAGRIDEARQYIYEAGYQSDYLEYTLKLPASEIQSYAIQSLNSSIQIGTDTDKKSSARKWSSLGSTVLMAGGAYTGAKINKDLQSDDPQKVAKATQAKKDMTVALEKAQQDVASNEARRTNNANKCLFAKDRDDKDRTSRIYVNGCDVPVYFAVVHYTPNKKYSSSVYFERVRAGGQHLVLETDSGATHATVTSCFSQPVRQFDPRDNGYYALCPDAKN